MSSQPLKRGVSVLAAWGILLTTIQEPVDAAEPGGVIRTFAVAMDPASSALDFLSDESLAVIVTAPERNPQSFQFTSTNSDSRFDSTFWRHQPALHITQEGASVPGSVWWLATPETPDLPPSGAITFTGPDTSLIFSQEVIYIQNCSAGTCEDYSGSRAKVFVSTPGNGRPMLIVTAVFSR